MFSTYVHVHVNALCSFYQDIRGNLLAGEETLELTMKACPLQAKMMLTKEFLFTILMPLR